MGKDKFQNIKNARAFAEAELDFFDMWDALMKKHPKLTSAECMLLLHRGLGHLISKGAPKGVNHRM